MTILWYATSGLASVRRRRRFDASRGGSGLLSSKRAERRHPVCHRFHCSGQSWPGSRPIAHRQYPIIQDTLQPLGDVELIICSLRNIIVHVSWLPMSPSQLPGPPRCCTRASSSVPVCHCSPDSSPPPFLLPTSTMIGAVLSARQKLCFQGRLGDRAQGLPGKRYIENSDAILQPYQQWPWERPCGRVVSSPRTPATVTVMKIEAPGIVVPLVPGNLGHNVP
ncbi:hypothetical protein F5Y15DRAFT_393076 [Xylariaceae sp. FL0016]|nr:hypothetical protein F5Y15DRAFT_393076 [Xylariaceae sp. FL0016]